MKMNFKKMRLPLGLFALAFLSFGLTACEGTANIEDYVESHEASPFDPSKPVTITRFTPESGGVGQQIVIYGSNFGNDPSIVDLKIGGKQAVVVSCGGDCMYTFMPSKCFTGIIELTIGEEGNTQSCVAEKRLEYERKMVVGTLCGFKNEDDRQGWKDGPFRDEEGNWFCCGFRNDGVMQFSPYNHDQLFIVYDQEPYMGTTAHGIQMLDLAKEELSTMIDVSRFHGDRLRTIDFAVDPFAYDQYGDLLGRVGDEGFENWLETASPNETRWREHLIVSADNFDTTNYHARSVYIVDRDKDGNFSNNSNIVELADYNACNGAYLHPGDKAGKHGQGIDTYSKELYFNSYSQGELFRLDMDAYWDTLVPTGLDEDGEPEYTEWVPYALENEAFTLIYRVGETSQEMQIDIHPTGDYAYIVCINSERILRTDYDWNRRTFLPPYIVAGQMNVRGFVDGVGTDAVFARPYQGTFVKNDAYAGQDDEYDFYLCDNSWYRDHTDSREAHAIRLMTPQGIVRTYAGGSANTHTDGHVYGSENGELRDVARFDRPTGLVNDVHVDKLTGENTLIFYILDTMNRKIRTITMEEPTDEEMADMGK